ncbi:MAG: TetR/AcrR family transcriptional regulator, partial [Crocinitomicaceae bacterium]|nr:TetR/AcrR family transcriptional regulator [Crocinitomicaceae bacterium]
AYTIEFGGCPILNIGVDAKDQNPELLERVQEVILRLQSYITRMIQNGIDAGEVRKEVNAKTYARKFFTLIEGAVFMSATMNDDSYIQEMMAHIDGIIGRDLAI